MNYKRQTAGGQPMVELPEIVRVVLTQASRMRRMGAITEQYFKKQVSRLEKEELAPRGLHLVVERLPDGDTKFFIKSDLSGKTSAWADGNTDMSSGRGGFDLCGSSTRSRR